MAIRRPLLIRAMIRAPLVGPLVNAIDDARLAMTYDLRRKYLRNPASARAFDADRPSLSPPQARIVGELAERGIAITHFDELIGDPQLWQQLRGHMDDFLTSDRTQQQLAAAAAAKTSTGKDHLIRLFAPQETTIPLDNIWLRTGLHSAIHDVVNTYLGLWSVLHSLNLWYTVSQNRERPRTSSQRWHRDPEDSKMVKVFMYFTDVGEEAGPLQYIPGSCTGGPYEKLWPFGPVNPDGYPPQDELERQIPADRWMTCVGRPGTIVFCNTSGFHRGGYAKGGQRALAFWTFVSPASLWPRQFDINWQGNGDDLRPAAKFALR